MLGSKAFDPSDTGLLCTACSRISALLRSVLNMCHWHIAPFLVGDGDDLCVHDFTSFLIVAVVSGNRKSRHFKINSEVTALSIAGIRVPEMKKAPSIYTVCYIKFIFNYSN